ncbi:DUF58 domain-containing protein [Rhodospirillum rubrum]|uniref:DUF58 domain-containing protein n=2 Tax=Rhodospirillum rubrum TaxID=1085 RepID=UPI001905019D|nr:DUF58 domain-containing protein [Rhodospirillum rubrum]MBK1663707.1 DUF58 domain-containing protein [Rhodospirillum rubrum]
MAPLRPPRPAAPAASLLDRAEAAGARLPPLLVAAERVASSVIHGIHGRRRAGPGEAFWQFRRYQQGDSPAVIDWRRSAKSDPVFVREYEWEAAQAVWLGCDLSASMDYASRTDLPSKALRARELTLALAVLLARGGERIALAGHDGRPGQGRPALVRMALALERGAAAEGAPPPSPWSASLARHARAVIIGDLLDPVEDLRAGLGRMTANGVTGHLLQVLDPAEETLPFEGRVRFEGLEGEAPLLADRVEDLRARYRQRLLAHRETVGLIARRAGWTFAVHHTDSSPQTALLGLYQALAVAPPLREGRR